MLEEQANIIRLAREIIRSTSSDLIQLDSARYANTRNTESLNADKSSLTDLQIEIETAKLVSANKTIDSTHEYLLANLSLASRLMTWAIDPPSFNFRLDTSVITVSVALGLNLTHEEHKYTIYTTHT